MNQTQEQEKAEERADQSQSASERTEQVLREINELLASVQAEREKRKRPADDHVQPEQK